MANWYEIVDAVQELQDDVSMSTESGPSLQWYPQQWLGDAAVQLMSMAARGCHHHLLMVAWKGFGLDESPVPCSVPDDPALLAALCQNPEDWDSILAEVRRAWKVRDGRLWNLGLCRAYLEQMKKRRSSKASADARWKRTESNRSANASHRNANASSQHADASDSQCSSVSSLQSSSSSSETPHTPPAHRKRRAETVEEGFRRLWSAYPKKRGRAAALKKWMSLGKSRPEVAEVLAVIEAAKRSEDWTRDGGQFIPHGSTFFREERWQDGPEAFQSNGRRRRGVLDVAPADSKTQELRKRRAMGERV